MPGACQITTRRCFLDNGLNGSIVAVGMADPVVQDEAHPTLAGLFCTAPTTSPAVNAATGLPGPARVVIEQDTHALP